MFENKSILIAVCHQDDETLFSGGLLAMLPELNAQAHVVCAIAPAKGRRDTRTRNDAQRRVVAHCGASVTQLDHDMSPYPRMRRFVKTRLEPEGFENRPRAGAANHPAYPAMKDAILAQISRHDPDIVITHNEVGEYGHHEHVFMNAIMADIAAMDQTREWLVFGNSLTRPTQPFPYDRERKKALFQYYLPQWDGLRRYPFALEDETYAELLAASPHPALPQETSQGA